MKVDSALLSEGRTALKTRFIELRARGLSYARISRELKVAKGTLASWNQELSEEIASLKAVQLEELYEKYYLVRAGRIELIGSQMKKLVKELQKRDFAEISTEKLLDLVLRYFETLKAEYIAPEPEDRIGNKMNAQTIVEALGNTLNRYKAGEIDQDRAQRETSILMSVIKAIETSELQSRLEALEAVLIGR
jgi:HEPN domain-containing protein